MPLFLCRRCFATVHHSPSQACCCATLYQTPPTPNQDFDWILAAHCSSAGPENPIHSLTILLPERWPSLCYRCARPAPTDEPPFPAPG